MTTSWLKTGSNTIPANQMTNHMQQTSSAQVVDNDQLKAQVDEEIAARLQVEADYARYIHKRGFNVGELKLLIDLDAASEVVELPPLFRLPGAPAGVKGLSNRHGRVVPVLDFCALFGAECEQESTPWLLVYGRGEEAVGVIIDSLPERKKFAVEDIVTMDEVKSVVGKYAKAAYREKEQIWVDVDMDALFGSVFKVDVATE